jgi:uncharacterized protein YprB with RNaseH-like and TPR domain
MNATGEELIWLRDHRCKEHGHKYLVHFNCFLREHSIEERVGCIDIEASGLKANFGVILSWAIKEVGTDNIYYDVLTDEDIDNGVQDKRLVQTCVDTMRGFDRLVGHYSCKFDIPFIRTRALIHDLDFPKVGSIYHTDTWRMARQVLCLHSNRQDCVAEALQHNNIKTRLHPDAWLKVQFGNKKERKEALAYVLEHNEMDVIQLEGNYLKLKPFCREIRSSI